MKLVCGYCNEEYEYNLIYDSNEMASYCSMECALLADARHEEATPLVVLDHDSPKEKNNKEYNPR